ncbi:MAG: alpha/beta fold hydrolase [Candidatus Thorarchaeota archaeon]
MIYQIDDLEMYYEVIGSGTPIVIIHGFTLDHRSMKECMEPIFNKRQTWQRIYLDLPGHGKTKGVEWIKNSDDMLHVLIDFIEATIPRERFLVAGLSYGGYLARGLIYKKMDLIDGLLLIVPRIVSHPLKRILPPRIVFEKDERFLSSLSTIEREGFEEISVILNDRVFNRYSKEITPAVQVADNTFLQRLDNTKDSFSFDVDQLPAKFEKPTLFLLGRQDHIVGYEDAWNLIEQYPRATLVVLDKAGHGLQMEQVNLFEVLVENWLDRTLEADSIK